MSDQRKVLVQVVLPKELVKEIGHLGVDLELCRAATVEMLLRDGFEHRKLREEGARQANPTNEDARPQ